jgi:hypothetical protein
MGIPPRRVWSAAPLGLGQRGLVPNLFDVIVFVIIAAVFAGLAHGAREMNQSLAQLDIAKATDAGDYPRIVLGIAVMSIFIVLINRLLWRPLHQLLGVVIVAIKRRARHG